MATQDQKQLLLRALERTVSNQIRAEQQGDMVLAWFYADVARELRQELQQKYGIKTVAGDGHERQAATHKGATDSDS